MRRTVLTGRHEVDGNRRTKGLVYPMRRGSGKATRRWASASPPTTARGARIRRLSRVTILVDDAMWPAHGRLWAHLVSDSDLAELHAFAAENGIPARGFDLDHYDVPEDAVERLIAAGAEHVGGKELVRRLRASGLRVTARERRDR